MKVTIPKWWIACPQCNINKYFVALDNYFIRKPEVEGTTGQVLTFDGTNIIWN
jgi:hypothetical protein